MLKSPSKIRKTLSSLSETFQLRAFAMAKIPLLYWCLPSVVEVTEERCEIRIPWIRRTKNHLGSMYFGVLCVGADCAGGLIAMNHIKKSGKKVSLIFKDFHADFLKRAEGGDVHFICEQGPEIRELVEKTLSSSERQELPVTITAVVPKVNPTDPVARFVLTLSLKKRD